MATATEVAASYGYSVQFFNADPELKKLLSKAVSNNWTTDKFVAMFRATNWYKTHGEAFRQIYTLKTTDPATYKQRVATSRSQLAEIAWGMGAQVPGAVMAQLAETALAAGWDQSQIKAALAHYVKAGQGGVYSGGAATVQHQLNQMLGEYGYKASDKQLGTWVSNIALGKSTVDQVQMQVINATASKYPALKERLMAGETLDDIAAPYKDSYARILEVNPQTISLNDATLQKALAAKDAKGAPTTQTVWQFEQNLRQDPRWLKTKNAQDSLVGQTHDILKQFGLAN